MGQLPIKLSNNWTAFLIITAFSIIISFMIVWDARLPILLFCFAIGWFFGVRYFSQGALALHLTGFYLYSTLLYIINIPSADQFTILFHLGLAGIYMSNVFVNPKDFKRALSDPASFWVLGLAIWMVINWLMLSRTSQYASTRIAFIPIMMLPAYFGIQMLSAEQIKKMLQIGTIIGIVGIVVALSNLSSQIDSFGRFRVAPTVNPLAFSYALGCSTVMMLSLSSSNLRRWGLLTIAYFTLAVLLILSSGSRGPILGLIIAVIVIAAHVGGRQLLGLVPLLAIAIVIVGVFVIPNVPDVALDRFLSTTEYFLDSTSSSTNGAEFDEATANRPALWRLSVEVWRLQPILGVGVGNFGQVAFGYNQFSHNVFFELLSETGLVGLSLFLIFLVLVISRLRMLYSLQIKDEYRSLLIVSVALFIYSFVELSFSGQSQSALLFWMSCGLILRMSKPDMREQLSTTSLN